MRILLVEDDLDAAESLKTSLELHGHDVRVARDGLAALRLIEPFSPDAAFIEIGLPRMDGIELVSHIRRHKSGAALLLVAVSGLTDAETKERALEAGFQHYVTKPIEFSVLESLLAMRAKSTSPGTATIH